MRRVINKLISDEDLFARRGRRVLAGLAPHQALLPDRAADRARRGRRRHRRARRRVRRAGRRAPPGRLGDRLGGRVRPQVQHARSSGTRWTRPTSCARKVAMLRDAARRTHGLEIRWHDPDATAAEGDRLARRPPRSARCSSASGATAGPSRSGPSASSCSAGPTPSHAEGLDLERHRAALARPRRDAAVGAPVRGAAPRLPLGRLRVVAARRGRWRTAAGRPCYDCGACTTYGIEHVVASAAPPAGGSQGTGPGPRPRRRAGPVGVALSATRR